MARNAPPIPALRTIFLAVLAQIPVLGLILARNLDGWPEHPVAGLYVAATVVGYYGLPLLLTIVVLSAPFLVRRRWALGVTGGLMAIVLFFATVDSQVYSVFKFHLDPFWIRFFFEDFRGLGVSTASVMTGLGILLAFVGMQFGVFGLVARWPGPRWLPWVGTLLCVAGAAFSQVVHIVAYERNDERITRITPRLPLYIPFTSHSQAGKYEDSLTMVGENRGEENDQDFHYPLAPIEYEETERSPLNVLVILMESWRASALRPDVTPNISAFADECVVYEEHISSGNATVSGVFGLFYGIHPTYWNAVKANNAAIHNPVLMDAVVDRGYAVEIFAESGFERHKVEDAVFRDIPVHDDFEGHTALTEDPDLTRRLIEFLDRCAEEERPFFTLAFYKASHYTYGYDESKAPFHPAKRRNLALGPGESGVEPYLNDYYNALHFDDAFVGEVIDHLRATGGLENTVVVISSDHGESFDDNGENYWGHGSNFTRFQTQVPLLVHFPGQTPRRVRERTTHLDLAPTLARRVLGVRNDSRDYSDGYDLFGELPPKRPMVIASYFNHAFVIDDSVFESRPLGLKRYHFDDVSAATAPTAPAALRDFVSQIGRFYSSETREVAGEETR